jgi:hypothetical protein
MADLGFQAASQVLGDDDSVGSVSGAVHDPLSRLVSLTSNFPSLAKWVSRTQLLPGLKESVGDLKRCVMTRGAVVVVRVNASRVTPHSLTRHTTSVTALCFISLMLHHNALPQLGFLFPCVSSVSLSPRYVCLSLRHSSSCL